MLRAATLVLGSNQFPSTPPIPQNRRPSNSAPPLPLPSRRSKNPNNPNNQSPPPNSNSNPKRNPNRHHLRSRYYKPIEPDGSVVASEDDGRAVYVGPTGLSYRLPGAPFDFQFSYSETPKVKPIAIREPAFLPFAPPTMNRPWTGKAPLMSKKDKERKKKIRIFEPLGGGGEDEEGEEGGKVMEMARSVELGRYPKDTRTRKEILGEPLARWEIRELLKSCSSGNRQVNLGRDGLTHNMLELIHTHWRRQEVCKVRCRGVPTVDMKNICRHLEEKTGGKIIHKVGGYVYLFRGRNYDPRLRPRYPVMLWKPATPVYPKLIQEAPEGLTKFEANEMRKKGQSLLPICKLAKNGIYINLVKDVRDAFEGSELVKIDCKGMEPSDYKKLGAKLKELVPCVLLSFEDEQILIYRGKEWKSKYQNHINPKPKLHQSEVGDSVNSDSTGQFGSSSSEDTPVTKSKALSPRMLSLWQSAIESDKALLLDNTELTPDSLLQKVEEFESISQATEHSYDALILPGGKNVKYPKAVGEDGTLIKANDAHGYSDDVFGEGVYYGDDELYGNLNVADPPDGNESAPFGSLPVDSIAKRLGELQDN